MHSRWADHYTHRAKKEGFRARSVYKLIEIQTKYKILRPGQKVLDLGCYPGSWSQYALTQVGEEGRVWGIDLKAPKEISDPRFTFFEADVLGLTSDILEGVVGKLDVILSDLAPPTTGVHVVDSARSMELCSRAYLLAMDLLKKGGNFVFKVFQCEEVRPFVEHLRKHFHRVKALRPSATRSASREIYVICIGYNNH